MDSAVDKYNLSDKYSVHTIAEGIEVMRWFGPYMVEILDMMEAMGRVSKAERMYLTQFVMASGRGDNGNPQT
jgi:hypothetical protein